MGSLGQDIRYALRQLNRSRGFAIIAILTLALGIGANTAIFSVIDSILLEPLPFPHQDRLVQVFADPNASNSPKGWIREYQARSHALANVSGYSMNTEFNVTGAGSAARAFGSTVSANLFETIGVHPALGRFFLASDAIERRLLAPAIRRRSQRHRPQHSSRWSQPRDHRGSSYGNALPGPRYPVLGSHCFQSRRHV